MNADKTPLRAGTIACPKDKAPLHFCTIAGLRTYHRHGKRDVYSARCPACGTTYDVHRPKD